MLSIDFQEGFDGDTVVVRVAGDEVARLEGVTTNLVISRADAVDLERPGGRQEVEVDVPTKGRSAALEIDLAGHVFLTANVLYGSLELRQVPERPAYL
jgi:hypothetical protein